ncbi:MAG: energy-coupling factor transporter transmembrane component T [Gordonia sp. (in: high G+C Gram-positive bacteria)]
MTGDPRTKLLVVLISSVLLFAPGGTVWIPAVFLIGLAGALSTRAWGRAAGLTAASAVLAVIAFVLPVLAPSAGTAVAGVVASFALRFAVLGGVVAQLIATTDIGEFTAALRAARVPAVLLVPGTVMLRFIPVVAAETAAVADAMRLRGLAGPWALIRQPLRVTEQLVVPAVASSLRIADDLTASGLLRGLAGEARPTTCRPPRLGAVDAGWLGFFALALGGSWLALRGAS